MPGNSKSKHSKKRKKQQGNPQKAAANTAEIEDKIIQDSIDPPMKRGTGEKPLYMRIIMLTIAVVMILGIVMSAAAGSTGFF